MPLPTAGQPWLECEYLPLIETYMKMLRLEINGQPYRKADFRREMLEGPLAARSKGSYEFKMSNISSVMFDLRKQWIRGYKPLPNRPRGGFVEAVTAAAKAHGIPRADLQTTDRSELQDRAALLLDSNSRLPRPSGNKAPQKEAARPRVLLPLRVAAVGCRRRPGRALHAPGQRRQAPRRRTTRHEAPLDSWALG
jgi:hypothetical protein